MHCQDTTQNSVVVQFEFARRHPEGPRPFQRAEGSPCDTSCGEIPPSA
jgi:hypothetical protein